MARTVPLIHPGAILLEDWLKPLGISQYALAKAIDVPPRRINEIVKGLRGITVDTALRLGAFFGTDAQSWVICVARRRQRLLGKFGYSSIPPTPLCTEHRRPSSCN